MYNVKFIGIFFLRWVAGFTKSYLLQLKYIKAKLTLVYNELLWGSNNIGKMGFDKKIVVTFTVVKLLTANVSVQARIQLLAVVISQYVSKIYTILELRERVNRRATVSRQLSFTVPLSLVFTKAKKFSQDWKDAVISENREKNLTDE